MKDKVTIALGYYKKVMIDRVIRLNLLEPVERDTFLSHINHTDITRMLEDKLITKHQYDELNNLLIDALH